MTRTPDTPAPRRPHTAAEVRRALDQLISEDSMTRALAFQPRPSDVLISTYPKSGTSWVQQIIHSLRTRGSMAFDEISEVVPWLEVAYDCGIDADAPQTAEPRAFKTHLRWPIIPKGGRYVYVTRDPKDVVVSYYHFFSGWMFERGALSLDQFARELFIVGSERGRYWDHVRGWWEQRHRADVLMLCFEHMRADLARHVRAIAAFIGFEGQSDRIELATRKSEFAYMHAHGRQFDEHFLRERRDEAMGLPAGEPVAKLRAGRTGDHRDALSPHVSADLDEIWQDEIARPLGLADYSAMRAALALP